MGKIEEKKIGILGLGRMGRCLVQGMLEAGSLKPNQLYYSTHSSESLEKAEQEFGGHPVTSNAELAKQVDILVLAIKPQNMGAILKEIGPFLSQDQTLLSIAASITTTQIEQCLPQAIPLIRAMPNTPAFVRSGITALCRGSSAGERDLKRAQAIFRCLGQVLSVDEKHMDAVTGLSGCGPAYIYLILESLTDAGIKVGLPREVSKQLASYTVRGASEMLIQTGKHPASLRDEVTTPAGCTIDGLSELEEGKLRITLIKAVVKATERAKELALESQV